jgi:hypothetical protein
MQSESLTHAPLKTPKAAAIAGIVFSILLIVAFSLLRLSVPANPNEAGSWLARSTETVELAINLIPLAGIAFLWFIGVLRDRLGRAEDRFFASVFFGSGLLYLAMLFSAAALSGAIIIAFHAHPTAVDTPAFRFARSAIYNLVNVYMMKMGSVFMFSTSTVALYTGFTRRWLAWLGYAMSIILLFGSYRLTWSFILFPLWVLLTSVYFIIDNARWLPRPETGSGSEMD